MSFDRSSTSEYMNLLQQLFFLTILLLYKKFLFVYIAY